jgi:AcrR family transcriptional regulator
MIDKRDLILAAAARVFARSGFHPTPVEAVAREAGVAVGTIYNYFGGKDELLAEIFRVEHARRQKYLASVLAEPVSATERLIKGLRAHVAAAIDNDSVARLVLQEGARPATCLDGRATRGGVLREFVLTALQDTALAERMSHDQLVAISLMLVGSVQALVEECVRSQESGSSTDRATTAAIALDALEFIIRRLVGELA